MARDKERRFSPRLFKFLVAITLIGFAGGFLLARWLYSGPEVLRVKEVKGIVMTSTTKSVCIKPRIKGPTCKAPLFDPNEPNLKVPDVGAQVRAGYADVPSERKGARYAAWLWFEPAT